jgi:F-type H+-transporting ATPase subunit b
VHRVTLTVSATGHPQVVAFPRAESQETSTTTKPPSPIKPEAKELLWGAGAFVVLAILVRLFLFPRLKKGMDARHDLIRGELEAAEATRTAAESEMAEYNAELAVVRAEGNARIDAARQTMEAERQARLAVVNAEIAERRSAAAAEAEAAKVAARDQVVTAGAQVTARAAELVLGQPVDADAARAAVQEAMSAGVH